MEHLFDTPKYDDLIYDVGLHKGEDAEFYLLKGFRVIAFEADPELALFCRQRLHEFIDAGQLIIVEGAIVDPGSVAAGETKVRFYKNYDNSVWGTVVSDWAERNERVIDSLFRHTRREMPEKVIEVVAVDFEEALRTYGVPYYMKIDIEGCDTVCVKALRAFKEKPSYVSIESDKLSSANTEGEIELLCELGYESFQAVNQATVPHQIPTEPSKEGRYVAHQFESGASGLFGRELKSRWCSKDEIIRRYRTIHLGYFLFGDDGVLILKSRNRAARLVNALIRRFLDYVTRQSVPGWYDTHARHASAAPDKHNIVA